MACVREVHEDDIGTQFLVTLKDEDCDIINVSTATVKQIIFQKPDGTRVVKTAGFDTDGSDGIIYYTTVAGDLDQHGIWQLQGYIEMGGASWYSNTYSFNVSRNI